MSFRHSALYSAIIDSHPTPLHSSPRELEVRRLSSLAQHHIAAIPSLRHDKIFSSSFVSDSELYYGTKDGALVHVELPSYAPTVVTNLGCPCYVVTPNPSHSLVAVSHPAGLTARSTDTAEVRATLLGATDLVFSAAWCSDECIVTGSRDCGIRVYILPPLQSPGGTRGLFSPASPPGSPGMPNTAAGIGNIHSPGSLWSVVSIAGSTSPESADEASVRSNGDGDGDGDAWPVHYDNVTHSHKIRAVSRQTAESVVTVSPEMGTTVRLWDLNKFIPVKAAVMPDMVDSICSVALSHSVSAVGSVTGVTVHDFRCPVTTVQFYPSHDHGWGVRSMAYTAPYLTVGGGAGSVSFVDTRTLTRVGGPHVLNRGRVDDSDPTALWLTVDVPVATMTLSWAPTHRALFAAGGPLQVAITGTAASVFS
ncbi:WD domain G-beta repeat [Carpediemonas membranifera]|uniref:WD domain G-beta repeat n=1 Tax=Carpediemonas membranifera TaxID=201153 RepID=A0A8J6B5Z9_9EUKA|nr:WD domain G-beta repeat [Carpediemonas membranifera]|eukprot:KAG9394984.1 WD domain G-beta repeat [Carpediemonas membranifera]